MTLVSPEFGTTSASESCLCRATVEPITIKFGTAEARRLNWAFKVHLDNFLKPAASPNNNFLSVFFFVGGAVA